MDVRHRLAVVAITAAVTVALPATAAMAAGTGTITSPGPETVVSGAVPIEVQVSGDTGLFGGNHQVQVRLADLAQQPLSDPVALDCLSGGDACRQNSTWGGKTFNPADFAPFATSAPACNGGYVLHVRVDGGSWTGHRVRAAVPPAAPSAVSVNAGTETATVSWTRAGHPDITGHQIQRRPAGGSWVTVGAVGAGAASWTDADAPAGDLEYRVATLRGDGAEGGGIAAPCSDEGTDLATFSAPAPATVRAAQSTGGGGSGGDSDGPSRPRPTTPAPGGGGGGDDGETPSEGDDGDEAPDAGDGAADPTDEEPSETPQVERRAGSRIAPPSAVEQTTRGSGVTVPRTEVDNPDAPRVADERERYYGEDDEFTEDLPFTEAAGGDGEPAVTTETRTIRVPGALQSVLGEELDLARVVQPIAGGLLLLTIALHLRRWIREGAAVT